MLGVVMGGTARLGTVLPPISWLCLCPEAKLSPQSYEDQELLRLIYYGGIQHEIRKAVWPFLLGHYQFGMTEAERKEVGEGVLPAQGCSLGCPGPAHWASCPLWPGLWVRVGQTLGSAGIDRAKLFTGLTFSALSTLGGQGGDGWAFFHPNFHYILWLRHCAG